MSSVKKIGFPSPLTPDEIKNKDEFGLRVMNAILGATANYREKRNKLFERNRKFAEGKQDVGIYLDQMMIDGNRPVADIHFKAVPIAKKFERVVVDGYCIRNERPKVTSLSKDVQNRKDRAKADARFRMEFGDIIAQMQQESGIALEDADAFTPQDPQELDIHFSLNDREREELLMQKVIDFVLNDNGITEKKRKFLSNIFRYNISGWYNYLDKNGRLIIDQIDPRDAIYDKSISPDFSDIRYAGQIKRMSIGEIRSYFNIPREREKDLWIASQKYLISGGYTRCEWDERFKDNSDRPYDAYVVNVCYFWWKCNKGIKYVEGKDRWGKSVFNVSKDIKLGEDTTRKTTGVVYPQTAYEGVGVMDTDLILQWGEQRNILREGEDKEKVLCPYIFNMPDNDGDMLIASSIDNIISNIMSMDQAVIKLNLIIAQLAPDGYIIDVAGLSDINLGKGYENVGQLELVSIRNQTGNMYWSSYNEDGSHNPQPPILPTQSAAPSKIETLINNYNFNLNCIRDYLGVNEYRDGSAVSPRTGFRVIQAQLDSSNTATWNQYKAYVTATQELIKQIGIRCWDSLVYGSDPNKGLLGILGRYNADLLKERKDITASSYDYVFEMEMEQYQKDQLEENITTALSAGLIELSDAIMIRRVHDYKIAEQNLIYLTEKRKKERLKEQEQMQRLNSEANIAAAQAAEQARAETLQIEAQLKSQIEQIKGDQSRSERLETLVFDLLRGQQDGKPIPPEAIPLMQQVLANRGITIEQELNTKVQQEQQIAMEEQMIAQQQEGV